MSPEWGKSELISGFGKETTMRIMELVVLIAAILWIRDWLIRNNINIDQSKK